MPLSIASSLQMILALLSSLQSGSGLTVVQQQAITSALQDVQSVAQTSPIVVSSSSLMVSVAPTSSVFTYQSGASSTVPASGWEQFTIVPNRLIQWKAQPSVNWIIVPSSGSSYSTGGTQVLINSQIVRSFSPGVYTGIIAFSAASSGPYFAPTGVRVILTVRSKAQTGPSLAISLDSSSPVSNQDVMGSTGNPLATYRFTDTSSTEGVKINGVTIFEKTTASKPDFGNLQLWFGSTLISGIGNLVQTTGGYNIFLNIPSGFIIPQGSSEALMLKGDIAPWVSGAAQDDQVFSFQLANASSVIAVGATSNLPAIVTGMADGNPMTVLRSTMTVGTTPLGTTIGRMKLPTDQFGAITFSANYAGSVALDKLTVTFTGSGAVPSLITANNVSLIDMNNNNVTWSGATEVANPTAGTVTWYFPNPSSTVNGYVIPAGATSPFTLLLNDAAIPPAPSSTVQSLSAMIMKTSDVSYTDGLDTSATGGITLSPSVITPISINSVTFAPLTMAPTQNDLATMLESAKGLLLQILNSVSERQ